MRQLAFAIIPMLLGTQAWAEGLLYVASSPAGAQVTLDGKTTRHRTPCQILTTAGAHKVTLVLTGHQMLSQRVRVTDSKVTRVSVTLPKATTPKAAPARARRKYRGPTGALTLITDVIGASISIDGRPTKLKTPVTVKIPVGRHTIRLAHGGAYVDQTVTIHKNNNAQIRVNLRPRAARASRAPVARRRGAADPNWAAWHASCVKVCKYKTFVKKCNAGERSCISRCPGQLNGQINNPGYYYPCADSCKNKRQFCLDSEVAACRQRCAKGQQPVQ